MKAFQSPTKLCYLTQWAGKYCAELFVFYSDRGANHMQRCDERTQTAPEYPFRHASISASIGTATQNPHAVGFTDPRTCLFSTFSKEMATVEYKPEFVKSILCLND